mmetsp:Transcript_23307/g.41331  ORF Transcript_23307/g.41331 Transcript_23307/m.41331 type:complete len:271 (+) Transcript_23307:210-1022(+)
MTSSSASNTATSNMTASTLGATAAILVGAAVHALAIGLLYKTKQKSQNNALSGKDHHHHHHHHHNHQHDHQDGSTCSDSIVITLPAWANDFYETHKDMTFTTEEEMMKVAIALADRNVDEKTGGPFGTAIFECDTTTGVCKLFSIGMNQVVTLNNSTLHGEMTAIQFGQKKLNNFTFGANKTLGKEYHLYTSCEPCCQCLGGTLWSGVSKLVCAASKFDAEAIGFDEGPVFGKSYDALESAGVKVVRNVLREEGAKTLKRYGETGLIYNA